MKAIVKTVVGKVEYQFELDGDKEIDTLQKLIALGNPPTFCDECSNDAAEDFRLYSNKDNEANTYIHMVCKKCGAQAKLGQYKSGGFFWHNFKKPEFKSGTQAKDKK